MSARGWFEAVGFGALALGLHAAVFWAVPRGAAGAAGAGAGGEDLLTLEAAPASYAAMVERFDAPVLPATPMALPPEPPKIALPRVDLPDLVMLPPEPPKVALPPEPEAKPEPVAEPVAKPTPKPQAEPAKPRPAKPRTADPAPQGQPAAQASNGQAAQRAAGAGGGAVAGQGGSAQAATLSSGREKDLRAQWGATIRSRIERRKTYPAAAGRAAGAVTVRLTVTRAGGLAGVSLAKSSGHDALDQAALQAVQRAGKFPAAPKGLAEPSYSFTLTMKFAR